MEKEVPKWFKVIQALLFIVCGFSLGILSQMDSGTKYKEGAQLTLIVLAIISGLLLVVSIVVRLVIYPNKEGFVLLNILRTQYPVLILLLIISSCGVDEKNFDKLTWNDRDDIYYANRESMVKDLMENHIKLGMSYEQVIELLGKPENFANMKTNTIGYEIMVDYGWNIDPVEGKNLYFEFSKDSIVIDFQLEHWEH